MYEYGLDMYFFIPIPITSISFVTLYSCYVKLFLIKLFQIKNTEISWHDAKKQLRKDDRYQNADLLDKETKERLFYDHVNSLDRKKRDAFYQVFCETLMKFLFRITASKRPWGNYLQNSLAWCQSAKIFIYI